MKKVFSLLLAICFLFNISAFATEATEAPAAEEPSVRYGVTNTKGVNVRTEAKAKSKLVESLPVTGTPVIILEEIETGKEIWYKVEFDDKTGYIRGDLLDEILPDVDEEKYLEIDEMFTLAAAEASANKASSTGAKSTSGGSSSGSTTKSSGGSVWIPTKGGSKYHSNSSCSNMSNPKKVTLNEAKSAGYSACKKCY